MPRLVLFEEGRPKALTEDPFLNEASLESLLEQNPELIALDEVEPGALPLFPIGRQVPLAGQALDLLFIDASGRLTAVEAKLRKNPEIRRQVAGQVLEYGAYLAEWTVEDVERQVQRYFASSSIPTRFRRESLAAGLSELATETGDSPLSEEDLYAGVASAIARRDLRLIIAVDRVVDSLRTLVSFVNGSSQFSLYLLEVQQFRSSGGAQVASINVYGGQTPGKRRESGAGGSARGSWDESKFFDAVDEQAGTGADLVRDLYSFIQEHADATAFGTGTVEGSAGFMIRRGTDSFRLFYVSSRAQVWITVSMLARKTPRHLLNDLLRLLRQFGVDASDEILSRKDAVVVFPVEVLRGAERMKDFKQAILKIQTERVGMEQAGSPMQTPTSL